MPNRLRGEVLALPSISPLGGYEVHNSIQPTSHPSPRVSTVLSSLLLIPEDSAQIFLFLSTFLDIIPFC